MGDDTTPARRSKVTTALAAAGAFALGWLARMWKRRRDRRANEDPGLTDPEAKPEVEEWGNESFPASDPPANY